jgi:S-adenosylmethionine uptake transporter
MSDPSKQNLNGALTALAAMGIFATHDVVIKVLGATYSPVQIVFFAAVLSFPLVTLFLLQDKTGGSLRPRNPLWVGVRTVGTIITGVSAFYAFGRLPLAQTYAILFAIPLIITILSIPILGEKVRLRRWAAVIVGLVGVMIVLRPGQADLSSGHLAALVAAFTGALSAISVRKVGADERPVVMLIYPMVGNFFVMGVALIFVYKPMPIEHLGLLAIIAVLGLIGSVLSILSYRMAEAVIVAPMQYSQIVWATVYSYLLFDEGLEGWTLVGAGIVILSGIYIVLRETRADTSTRPVLETRGKTETVTTLRSGLLQRLRAGGRVGR